MSEADTRQMEQEVESEVESGVESSDFLKEVIAVWNNLRNGIRRIIDSVYINITYLLTPDVEDGEAHLITHRDNAVAVITEFLGNDPAQTLLELSTEERALVIIELQSRISNALGMEGSAVVFAELNGSFGCYIASEDCVVINVSELDKHPMTHAEAMELLGTICHETYHSLQHKAIRNPHKFGISKAEARMWKINFENYIHSDVNPERYFYQPVEYSAFVFEISVLKCIYKED